jgi:hypothetical protein
MTDHYFSTAWYQRRQQLRLQQSRWYSQIESIEDFEKKMFADPQKTVWQSRHLQRWSKLLMWQEWQQIVAQTTQLVDHYPVVVRWRDRWQGCVFCHLLQRLLRLLDRVLKGLVDHSLRVSFVPLIKLKRLVIRMVFR